MKAYIIHGAFGNPDENWFQWLGKELGKLGLDVTIPKFPTPYGQSLDSWQKVMDNYDYSDSVMVGHSLGVPFILHLAIKKHLKAAFLVSGFFEFIGNNRFDLINRTFIDVGFDWDLIRANCSKFAVFHSNDDPYVPMELGGNVAKKLKCDFYIVKNAGHFNSESGYTRFDFLLDRIKEFLKES